MISLPAVLQPTLLAAALLAAHPASARAPEVVDPERAAQIQEQAQEALNQRHYEDAARLAGRAVDLDPSLSTWLARQIQIEALEGLGRLDDGLTLVEQYLDLDGLFAEHRSWGKDTRLRLRTRIDRRAQDKLRTGRRGLGVGLVIGGAAPLGAGIALLANYGRLGGDFDQYGGWVQAGAVSLGVGLALDVVGFLVLGSAGPAGPSPQSSHSTVFPTWAVSFRLGLDPQVSLHLAF